MPELFDDVGECVAAALRLVGRRVVLALPLGIGKPNHIANEFFRRAAADSSIELTIVTALSLRRPTASSDLERRLAGPLIERVFGDYPELDYLQAMRADRMPPNVRIIEFFIEPGAWLNCEPAQSNYIATNYTHVVRELISRGVNVIAQLVAKRTHDGDTEFSLGSNADVMLDLLPHIAAERSAGKPIAVIGAVHPEMPFMVGSARVPAATFDIVLEHERYAFPLFAPPNPALSSVDHAIGLHASALVRDGGTLQIGIGELGDAVCYALLLRHQQNAAYRQALADLGTERAGPLISAIGGREAFAAGLFGSTEMLVDQMLDLYRAGVLRRRVYDYLPLQRLLVAGLTNERIDASLLERLLEQGVGPRLSQLEFETLRHYGVFREETQYRDGRIAGADGGWIDADLESATARAELAKYALGRELRNGVLVHAGFFLGPRAFYAALRALPESERQLIDMRGVGFINQLYGPDYELKLAQRAHARCINTTMMVTTLGAAVSDGLADGRVVSGVGGQYNFVAMAHALADARSILCVRATRTKAGRVSSNIVPSYGHVTIPRHLRDIVITEYGIADLRGRTDAECIAALIGIADARFQDELLASAQRAGKISREFRIPEIARRNTPVELERALAAHRQAGRFSEYPFGTDLTAEEVRLARALRGLRAALERRGLAKVAVLVRAITQRSQSEDVPYLMRMGLNNPANFREHLLRRLVAYALRAFSPG